MQVRLLLLLVMLAVLTACGGGSSSNSSPAAFLAGNWQMNLIKDPSLPNGSKGKTQSGFLSQQKNAVTGSLMFNGIPCSGIGTVTGSVSGANVSLTVNPVGIVVNLTGTVGSDQASMSGSYTIVSQGCSGTYTAPEDGTWTANLVQPLSGNLQGTFTSQFQEVIPVTGQVSQSQSTGSSAPLSGNLSVTGYCFSSASVSGVISGTSVVMNLLNADGTQVGQVEATTSLDGKSLTGSYTVLPQGPNGVRPCINGDHGSINLSL